jgi:phosphate butyryltransferase
VLGSTGLMRESFSFSSLLDEVTGYITEGVFSPANLVLVGADNEDALVAVSNAKDYGLVKRLVLIGAPDEITDAVERSKVPLSPGIDPTIQILPINPLATDIDAKKMSTAEVFRNFLGENDDFIIMKGSIDTASLLQQALSIYKTGETDPAGRPIRKFASHTAIFILPDGRMFALSDAAVNPGFRNVEGILGVIENQVELVRKVVDSKRMLKVAIITAVEKETSAIPSTMLAAQAEQQSQELIDKYGPMVIEGPLSLDLATVPEVAEEKHYHGRIMGDANCLVATDINTANVVYKMLTKTMGSLGLVVENASIITAGPGTTPIVLTSRGDTAQTKFNSILMALAYASMSNDEKRAEVEAKRGAGKLKPVSGGK